LFYIGPMLKNNTLVIFRHLLVNYQGNTAFITLNYHGIAVDYCGKSFYGMGPWCQCNKTIMVIYCSTYIF